MKLAMTSNSSYIARVKIRFNQLGFVCCILLAFFSVISTAGGAISMGCVYICFLLSGCWKDKINLLKHPMVWASLLILIWVFMGITYSVGSWHQGFEIAGKYHKVLLIWCILYFVHGNRRCFMWLMGALIAGVLVNLVAIYFNYFILPPDSPIRFMTSNWPSAQSQGSFALFTVVFAFLFIKLAFNQGHTKRWRCLCLAIGLVALYAEVFLNHSRTGYVSELIVILYFMLQLKNRWKILAVAVCIPVLFGSAYWLSPVFKQRVNQAYFSVSKFQSGKTNTTSVGVRLYFYQTSLHILLDQPQYLIFGHGSGSYQALTERYNNHRIDKNPNFNYISFTNPHNQFLLFLLENGVVGLGLFLFFLLIIWRYGLILPDTLRILTHVALVSMTVNMCFNATFMDFITSMPFVVLVGLLAGYLPQLRFNELLMKRSCLVDKT